MRAGRIELAAQVLAGVLEARRESGTDWPLVALGVVLGSAGTILLAIAVDLELAVLLSAPAAAAIVGALLLALALALILVARRPNRAARSASPEALPIAALTEFAEGLLADADAAVQSSPKSAALAAFAAGCIIGFSPRLQRGLRDLFR